MTRLTGFVMMLLGACTAVLVGCGSAEQGLVEAAPSTTPVPVTSGATATPAPAGSTAIASLEATGTPAAPSPADPVQRCVSPEGWSVEYPRGWFTNETIPYPTEVLPEGGSFPACSLFRPEPIPVQLFTEIDATGAVVSLRVSEFAFDAEPEPDELACEYAVERREAAGRAATRAMITACDGGPYPAGTQFVFWTVELSSDPSGTPRVLTALSIGSSYVGIDESARVVDNMMASLELASNL